MKSKFCRKHEYIWRHPNNCHKWWSSVILAGEIQSWLLITIHDLTHLIDKVSEGNVISQATIHVTSLATDYGESSSYHDMLGNEWLCHNIIMSITIPLATKWLTVSRTLYNIRFPEYIISCSKYTL